MARLFFGRGNGVSSALLVLVAMLALALPLAARAELGNSGRPRTALSPTDGLPKVSLTDQNGRAISLSSLKGKPALVAFIHTSCEGPCELITAQMKSVARDLGPGFKSKVTMVSITTEPKEDGSRELLAYAKAQGVDADGWVFLTGAPGQFLRRNVRRVGLALIAVHRTGHEVIEKHGDHRERERLGDRRARCQQLDPTVGLTRVHLDGLVPANRELGQYDQMERG